MRQFVPALAALAAACGALAAAIVVRAGRRTAVPLLAGWVTVVAVVASVATAAAPRPAPDGRVAAVPSSARSPAHALPVRATTAADAAPRAERVPGDRPASLRRPSHASSPDLPT